MPMRKNLIRTLPVFIFLFASLLSPGPLAAESRSQDPPYDWHYPETSIPYGTALEDDTEELGEWTDDATFRETGIFEASYTEDLDAFYTYDPEAEMPEHREACFAIHEEAKPAYQLTQLTVYYRTILSEDEGEIAAFFDGIEAGVTYANRRAGATTGAWPGVNSFGGWKGSGSTGRGTGGPYYLQQFLREQSRVRIR